MAIFGSYFQSQGTFISIFNILLLLLRKKLGQLLYGNERSEFSKALHAQSYCSRSRSLKRSLGFFFFPKNLSFQEGLPNFSRNSTAEEDAATQV